MISLRLVIDTNIIVSAALKPAGQQRTVVLLAITKPARLYVSDPIPAEYGEVLSRLELKIRQGLQRQLIGLIGRHSHPVNPSRHFHVAQARRRHIPGMRRCRPSRLSSDRQPAALS
jgi:putative PIN family toxin of toxin-antitoxin system